MKKILKEIDQNQIFLPCWDGECVKMVLLILKHQLLNFFQLFNLKKLLKYSIMVTLACLNPS